MNKEQFHGTLKDLHRELSSIKQTDTQSLDLIKQIHDDIDSILDQSEKSDHLSSEKSLLTQLQNSSEYFEVSHPRLMNLVNNVISTLNNLGI